MELRKFIESSLIEIIESGATGPIEFDIGVTPGSLGEKEIICVMHHSQSRIKFTIEID